MAEDYNNSIINNHGNILHCMSHSEHSLYRSLIQTTGNGIRCCRLASSRHGKSSGDRHGIQYGPFSSHWNCRSSKNRDRVAETDILGLVLPRQTVGKLYGESLHITGRSFSIPTSSLCSQFSKYHLHYIQDSQGAVNKPHPKCALDVCLPSASGHPRTASQKDTTQLHRSMIDLCRIIEKILQSL